MNQGPSANGDRLVSLDAYRGFVMLAMVSAGMGMGRLLNDPTWGWLARQLEHRAWEGCTFWDLIQPSFMFIVGVAMPFSLAKREGQTWGWQFLGVLRRCLSLVLLGIFLDTYTDNRFYLQFIRVLQQIAIGYLLAFFVYHLGSKVQFITAILLLAGHTAAYLIYANAMGMPPWRQGDPLNTRNNFGVYLDSLLHLEISRGGYVTFNAVSSTATILFGLLTGQLLRSGLTSLNKLAILTLVGLLGLAAGWLLSGGVGAWYPPPVPMIKRLWTASFCLWAAGWTFLMLAFFYLVIDVIGFRWWSFPFIVVGMNSIAMYVIATLFRQPITRGIRLYFFNPDTWPVWTAVVVMLIEWWWCFFLYRRKVFFKV